MSLLIPLVCLVALVVTVLMSRSSDQAEDDEDLEVSEGPPSLEFRFRSEVDTNVMDHMDAPSVTQHLELRGQVPVTSTAPVLLTYSIFDVTDDDYGYPVECFNDDLREPETCVFQGRAGLGFVSPDRPYAAWATVHSLPLDLLTVEHRGGRRLKVILSLWYSDQSPAWRLGHASGANPIWRGTRTVSWHLPNDHLSNDYVAFIWGTRRIIRLAVALAASHRGLEDATQEHIRAWILETLRMLTLDEEQFHRRYRTMDTILWTACQAARNQTLEWADELNALSMFTTPNLSRSAVSLCSDLLGGPSHMSAEEASTMATITGTLGVSLDTPAWLRGTAIPHKPPPEPPIRVDLRKLGIEQSWSKERIRKHLTAEYRKWNSRATALEDPIKRREAERMIRLIVEARRTLVGD